MISLEIFPGLWWRQVDTVDLPQDGQRLVRELERRFLHHTVSWIERDWDRQKDNFYNLWLNANMVLICQGVLGLNWRMEMISTETTDKHFIRHNGRLVFMIEGIHGEPHDWGKKDEAG